MADEPQQPREQPREPQRERSEIDFSTLVITAVASAVAAFIASKVWERGALASAAFTPVIVALVKEALRRPSEAVTRRGAEPGRFSHHWRRAALTGLAGFVIFAVLITVSELAAGGAATGDKRTTLFGSGKTRTVVVKERTVTVQTVTNNVTTVTPSPTTVVTVPGKDVTTTTTVTTAPAPVPTTPTQTTETP